MKQKEFVKTCELSHINVDKDNIYYGIYDDYDKLLSLCSYKAIGKNEARLKSNYTLKDYRKKGFMTTLINYIYHTTNFNTYSAYCEKESVKIYLKLGFKFIKTKINKKFTCYIVKKEKKNGNCK